MSRIGSEERKRIQNAKRAGRFGIPHHSCEACKFEHNLGYRKECEQKIRFTFGLLNLASVTSQMGLCTSHTMRNGLPAVEEHSGIQ